ncbi:DNA-binding MarR family transcriptional regulator [Paenibacillus shirakamiensis]|uniref:DNA-binding MarR family transcriptional regulator n=1 Tax=Paenibacillus shirakamiensis TaxID=1265935 RepID=A0ABS4JH10_9BACL|nr:metalloregulator ArsR/SmtB family transcription factor [Paenibacillus shirakamiensis]MBP2001009.1 DNA-binding MarR family transcriptional regulator [Paenibacillus shirakamiensis]
MQLEKLVAYHKALGDPTRLRMLMILSKGEASGLELADKLTLSQPTITHHTAKLREASILKERRERNTVFFSVNEEVIRIFGKASLTFILEQEERTSIMHATEESFRDSVLRNFIAKDGGIRQIPSQLKKKLIVLEYMIKDLEKGRSYTEREINDYIRPYHADFATLRRELIMHQFMYRQEDKYELNPTEMWAQWTLLN